MITIVTDITNQEEIVFDNDITAMTCAWGFFIIIRCLAMQGSFGFRDMMSLNMYMKRIHVSESLITKVTLSCNIRAVIGDHVCF